MILTILAKAKSWLLAAAGFISVIGVLVIGYLKRRLEQEKQENEYLQAQIRYDEAVEEADEIIESDTDLRTQEMADAIEKGEPVENLARPNEW